MAERRAARRQAREVILCEMRSLDNVAERPRQWTAGLPDRRCATTSRRICHLPHRSVDGRPQDLRSIPMAVLRDRPYVQFNFLVDIGDGQTEGPVAGFQELS